MILFVLQVVGILTVIGSHYIFLILIKLDGRQFGSKSKFLRVKDRLHQWIIESLRRLIIVVCSSKYGQIVLIKMIFVFLKVTRFSWIIGDFSFHFCISLLGNLPGSILHLEFSIFVTEEFGNIFFMLWVAETITAHIESLHGIT